MEIIKTIFLIEDKSEIRDGICNAIKKEDPAVKIISITKENVGDLTQSREASSESKQLTVSNEALIGRGIENLAEGSRVHMIVVDHDLSLLAADISESSITAAAHTLAIPVCRYHRAASGRAPFMASSWELNSRVFAIDIDSSPASPEFAKTILNLLEGFMNISDQYVHVDKDVRKRGAPAVLAEILNRPLLVDHFSLYASGISFINDPLIISKISEAPNKTEFTAQLEKRIPYVLGYWLYNSILRFPGLILNKIATASYLDIHIDDFEREPVKNCFRDAEYSGPFSKDEEYWWRPDLDDMIVEAGGTVEFLLSAGYAEEVRPSVCSVTRESAGYYDLFSGEAISKEHSVGGLSWIPRGADLTRAALTKYEELAPILNL